MSEKNYKFCVLEPSASDTDEICRYIEDDENVFGFVCFTSFADAKHYYLECLQKKVDKALKLKQKEVQ